MMMMLATQAMKREKTEIGNERPDEAERLSDFNKKKILQKMWMPDQLMYTHTFLMASSPKKKSSFMYTVESIYDWVWMVDYNKRKETIM